MASDQTPQVDKHPLHEVLHRLANTLDELLHHFRHAVPSTVETHGTPVNEDMATALKDVAEAAPAVEEAVKAAETVVKDV